MLEKLRMQLASAEALLPLALLGMVLGVLVAALIVLFRFTIEYLQMGLLPGGQPENYEALSLVMRVALPTLGGLLIGLLLQYLFSDARQVGVVHVMERLTYHQGRLPWKNAIAQFVGAALSVASGHSVGREGPGIHLGATSGSQLGRWLRLPNNSIQTLTACGVAAAIAASFNTPIAGVIFAMEVVMMEYALRSFTPLIAASVSATAFTRLVYGPEPAFTVPPLQMGSVLELPYVLLAGIAIGVLAVGFITLLRRFAALLPKAPLWSRTTLAGLITGLCALAVPAVMGIGYDTVSAAMLGKLGLGLMAGIVLFKLVATAAAIGLGLPGGLIGPTLVIGAAAGGAMGLVAGLWFPEHVSSHGFYAMLGMGAMMGATLQAPLAALMAMLELTANPNILLPGMLAVITAGMTASELFNKESVFVTMLRARGLDYRNDPVAQSLRALGIAAVMNRQVVSAARSMCHSDAAALLTDVPQWIVVSDEDEPRALLPASDLGRYLQDAEAQAAVESTDTEAAEIDLLGIPARRRDLSPIGLQANLQEALDVLDRSRTEALFVTRDGTAASKPIYGVLTRQDIESHYRYQGPQ
ncbi:MAG: chloride channel protein [Pseudomonadota bacterium]|nr:MAG: chloride channel protein [Pseudomonadota bacterium]